MIKGKGGQTEKTLLSATPSLLYKTNLDVNRLSFFSKNGLITDADKNESFALIMSGAFQDQKSYFGFRDYNAKEKSFYAALLYEKDFTIHNKISAGLSLNHLNVDERFIGFDLQDMNETTTGIYSEYTYNNQDNLIILAGLRVDYSNYFNFFVTPRLHVKYNFTDWLHIRGTLGKGYRTPLVIAENQYYLVSNRKLIFPQERIQEKAWNYGMNIGIYLPVFGEELVINGEWYYTDFQEQMVVDLDTDSHSVLLSSLNGGKSYSSIFQMEASYPFFRGFNLTAAFRWMDVKITCGNVLRNKSLSSDYKALLTASYQTRLRKWQFDITSQFNGKGRIPVPNEANPLWSNTFPAYAILNAQITKNFRDWSIYGGVENMFNYTQKSRIIGYNDPFGENFDATMIWGPVHGRKFYIGLRYNIQRL